MRKIHAEVIIFQYQTIARQIGAIVIDISLFVVHPQRKPIFYGIILHSSCGHTESQHLINKRNAFWVIRKCKLLAINKSVLESIIKWVCVCICVQRKNMMPYNIRVSGSNAMAREYAGGSINGILRKTGAAAGAASSASASGIGTNGGAAYAGGNPSDPRQPALELLVFGYACKIFRDDEKAREMDHGKQLIPWMGDVNLKIDRLIIVACLHWH